MCALNPVLIEALLNIVLVFGGAAAGWYTKTLIQRGIRGKKAFDAVEKKEKS